MGHIVEFPLIWMLVLKTRRLTPEKMKMLPGSKGIAQVVSQTILFFRDPLSLGRLDMSLGALHDVWCNSRC